MAQAYSSKEQALIDALNKTDDTLTALLSKWTNQNSPEFYNVRALRDAVRNSVSTITSAE